jgi:hypothetical protein
VKIVKFLGWVLAILVISSAAWAADKFMLSLTLGSYSNLHLTSVRVLSAAFGFAYDREDVGPHTPALPNEVQSSCFAGLWQVERKSDRITSAKRRPLTYENICNGVMKVLPDQEGYSCNPIVTSMTADRAVPLGPAYITVHAYLAAGRDDAARIFENFKEDRHWTSPYLLASSRPGDVAAVVKEFNFEMQQCDQYSLITLRSRLW